MQAIFVLGTCKLLRSAETKDMRIHDYYSKLMNESCLQGQRNLDWLEREKVNEPRMDEQMQQKPMVCICV